MSEPAKAEKAAPPKAAAAKPKSTAPLPKQPGQSPATPALAKLRRALGELIVGYKTGRTHMFGIYAANLRSALDAAGKVRSVATDAERKDLDGLELRSRMLLIHVPGPDAKSTSDDGRLVIDWDYISDSIDHVVPGVGQVATKAPQQYRDCFEAVWRSTLYIKDAFREQWAEIQKHWFEFLYATATIVALETAALIASAMPGTQLLGIVVQALIIAFIAYAAVNIGIEASQLTDAFWLSVKEANGDPSKIDAAAAKFARLVIYILRLLAEAVAGGVLAKLSMNGMKRIMGDQPVTPRATPGEQAPASPKEREPTPGSATRKPSSTEPASGSKTQQAEPAASKKPATTTGSKPLRRYAADVDKVTIAPRRGTMGWSFEVNVPIEGTNRSHTVGRGGLKIDANGPVGGPKFTIDKSVFVDGVEGKVQIYKNGELLSATDVVLDKTIEAFTKEFGHPPETLPGSLAWENQFHFQVEYTKARMRGLSHDAACQVAIREISFGRSRAKRGYNHFTVKAESFVELKLGALGKHIVPSSISVDVRRGK